MLSNEKYAGVVRLLDSVKNEIQYVSENNNSAIISKDVFQAVQIEKVRRSNISQSEDGNRQKDEKYSSKNIII